MSRPPGRVALVTGASRGIGAAIARLFGESGFSVVVNYHRMKDKAEEVVAHIQASGSRATAVCADVRDPVRVEAMIQSAVNEYGSIDVLVNNAGGDLLYKPFGDFAWDDFQRLIDVQVRGAVQCCRVVLPFMEQKGRGSIINIISTVALGNAPAKMSPYVTVKAAMIGFSKALASEYAPKGIRVNMISPGFTETDLVAGLPGRMKEILAAQNPMKRLGRPQDCAQAALFLATDGSEFISGANLVVSGGQVVV